MLKDLRTYLVLYVPLAVLVGPRVNPVGEGQASVMPRVSYQQISQVALYSHSGDSGLYTTRVQINCVAEDEGQADQIAGVVRRLLSGYQGFWGGTKVHSCFLANDVGDYQPAPLVYFRRIDFLITHSEMTP